MGADGLANVKPSKGDAVGASAEAVAGGGFVDGGKPKVGVVGLVVLGAAAERRENEGVEVVDEPIANPLPSGLTAVAEAAGYRASN